jgi:hypothetical protein
LTMTVYMPRGFDDEAWRNAPADWLPELKERGELAADGTAEFLVADILGTAHVTVELEGGELPTAPEGTNFVVSFVDGDPGSQGDTIDEIVAEMRESMADWDWPMEVMFVFWRHHQNAQRLAVQYGEVT